MNLKNKITVEKDTRKDSYNISKFRGKSSDRFNRGFSNYSKQGRLKRYKRVWLTLGMIVCVGLTLFFLKGNSGEVKLSKSDKIQAYVYYSRGSRDKERKEQYVFKVNDPIQVKIDFKDMNDGDIITVSLKKLGSDEVKYSVEVPVNSGEGNRFISLSSLVREESSKYKIEVYMEINEKIILLEKTEFEII